MGTSIRRTTIWLVLATLFIGAAARATSGATATPGAQPTTGRLKIIKNLGGGWPDGAFMFTWTCDDGQNGRVTFPDEFTGANFTTTQDYPLGTKCTVEETDGVLSVSDYDVTTHIESTAGFQSINPRVVPIDNSAGQNTIQYQNDLAEPLRIAISKVLVGGPANTQFEFTLQCDLQPYPNVTLTGTETKTVDVPADTGRCKVTEVGASSQNGLDDWTTTPARDITLTLGTSANTQAVLDGPAVVFEFTNTFIEPEPETGRLKIIKQPTPGNASGPWKFTWVCNDNTATTGTATYPDDFTGAEYDVPAPIALGSDCTVTETFPNGDSASWNTSYQVEGGPFQAGTVAVVGIDNGKGSNTVKFENDFIEPEPENARVTVHKVGPLLDFGFAVYCSDQFGDGFSLRGGTSTAWTFRFGGLRDTITCTVLEEQLTGWTTTIVVTGAVKSKNGGEASNPSTQFAFGPGDDVTVTFTNVAGYLSVPPTGLPPRA
jgi:hypothetical protein